MMKSKPIPFSKAEAGTLPPGPSSPKRNDESLLSRSLGYAVASDIGDFHRRHIIHRQNSLVANLTHTGYLMKRSNKPYKTMSPLPLYPFDSVQLQNKTEEPFPDTPLLQPKQDAFESSSDRDSPLRPQPSHVPQHFFAVNTYQGSFLPLHESVSAPEAQEVVASTAEQNEKLNGKDKSSGIEETLSLAASFFGVSISNDLLPSREKGNVKEGESTTSTTIDTSQEKTTAFRKTQPIKMNRDSFWQHDSGDSFDANALHRRDSAPILPPADSSQDSFSSHLHPSDWLDPTDGHIWRAKYCVLEDGILYFYRNYTDGSCSEACMERQTTSNMSEEDLQSQGGASLSLARSPMPGRLLRPPDSTPVASCGSLSTSGFMWEKRVALNRVGAVRSAEQEYGDNSFELLAVEDTDDEGATDKLVLRAPNSDQMNEWLFQFHRSLTSFMVNMLELLASKPSGTSYVLAGDIHHPGFAHPPSINPDNSFEYSPMRSMAVLSYSPRMGKNVLGEEIALSHGHGRNARHRKRVDSNRRRGTSPIAEPKPPTTLIEPRPPTPTSSMSQSSPMPFPLGGMSPLVSPLVSKTGHPPEETNLPPLPMTHQLPLVTTTTVMDTAGVSTTKPALEAQAEPPPPRKGKYVPPQRREGSKKYVPPHLRKKASVETKSCAVTNGANKSTKPSGISNLTILQSKATEHFSQEEKRDDERSSRRGVDEAISPTLAVEEEQFTLLRMGGCVDPTLAHGSILDAQFIPRKASKVGPTHTKPFGSSSERRQLESGLDKENSKTGLQWEIGAVSECGVRSSNEDAYLIANDLISIFNNFIVDGETVQTVWEDGSSHQPGLFAVFDGHCGDQAARFTSERLLKFIFDESEGVSSTDKCCDPLQIEDILTRALRNLDDEFCQLCVEGGREWESGTCALIAALANDNLVFANIGDCRGVIGRSVDANAKDPPAPGWQEIPALGGGVAGRKCYWTEVSEVHSPSRPDEKERIERAGGWTTSEKEIPISQFQRMDLMDEEVFEILRRFMDRYDATGKKSCNSTPQRILQIHRVCGELAVSRAIGDRDFKAAFNMSQEKPDWKCPLLLPFPDDHSRVFSDDLVSSKPEFHTIEVGAEDSRGEFLVMACDGLWDVMDADDAVRVTHELLFEKKWAAKRAAARLAELAIHLGSSDNVTVIVIRFIKNENNRK